MKTLLLCSLILFNSVFLTAQVPRLISWQGVIQDNAGNNLNGNYDITYKLYSEQSDGVLLWSETQENFPITDGLVNTIFGTESFLPENFGKTYWLEITVGTNPPLPRTMITPSPSSLYAEDFSGELKNRNLNITRNNGKNGFSFDSQNLNYEVKKNDTVWFGIDVNYGVPGIYSRLDDSLVYQQFGEAKYILNLNTSKELFAYEITRGIEGNFTESYLNSNLKTGDKIMEKSNGMFLDADTNVIESKYNHYYKKGEANYYVEQLDNNGMPFLKTYYKYDNLGDLQRVYEIQFDKGTKIREDRWSDSTFNKIYSYSYNAYNDGTYSTDEWFYNPMNGDINMYKSYSLYYDGTDYYESELEEFWNDNARSSYIQKNKVNGKLTKEEFYTYNSSGIAKKTRELSYDNGIKYEETMFGSDGFPIASPKIVFDPFIVNGKTNIFGPGRIELSSTDFTRFMNPTYGSSFFTYLGNNTEVNPALKLDVAHGVNQQTLLKSWFDTGVLQTQFYGVVKFNGIISALSDANFVNINVNGNSYLNGDIFASSSSAYFDEVETYNLTVEGSALFQNGLTSHGSNTFTGSMQVYSGVNIGGNVNIGGSLTASNLEVYSLTQANKAIFNDSVKVNGHVRINGNLNVLGEKNFRIDHPDDPYNKFLFHASIESDDVLNQYSGNITTNHEGYAIVTLPDYVEKINIDFRYQLTVIGDFAQAIISKEIAGNQFEIRTDKPNIKVSWMITGKRNDDVMKFNPFNAVRDKTGDEKGQLLLGTKTNR